MCTRPLLVTSIYSKPMLYRSARLHAYICAPVPFLKGVCYNVSFATVTGTHPIPPPKVMGSQPLDTLKPQTLDSQPPKVIGSIDASDEMYSTIAQNKHGIQNDSMSDQVWHL